MASWAEHRLISERLCSAQRIGLSQNTTRQCNNLGPGVGCQNLTDQRHVLVCQARPTMLFQKGAHVLQSRQGLTIQLRFASGKIEKQCCEFDRVASRLLTVGLPEASMIAPERSGCSRAASEESSSSGMPVLTAIRTAASSFRLMRCNVDCLQPRSRRPEADLRARERRFSTASISLRSPTRTRCPRQTVNCGPGCRDDERNIRPILGRLSIVIEVTR